VSAASVAMDPRLQSAEWSKACGHCRRTYDVAAWARLPAVATLPPQSVQAHLSVPASWTIELRRCACSAVLAARSR
jgi:hypothetical protein